MDGFSERAAELDAADSLARCRDWFELPDGVVYLDGNSLGPLPSAVRERVARTLDEEWATGLIRSWSDADWWHLPTIVGDRIAPLIGAGPGQVAVGDSTSVDLFKLLGGALRLRPDRPVVLVEDGNFPTDTYVAQGLVDLVGGRELRRFGAEQDPGDVADERTAVVLLSHVDYRTGARRSMSDVTAAVHRAGSLVCWDLSHSTGAVPVDLLGAGADLAAGCTYKYLNGGPGAPAFAWVHPDLSDDFVNPVTGWWGHADPFAMAGSFEADRGARKLAVGTAQILSLVALEAATRLWAEVDLAAVVAKSRSMTSLFVDAVESFGGDHGLELITPRDPGRRGSHVSFDHPHADGAMRALVRRGVIGDFRRPNTLRFGFAPLYLSHGDVVTAARHLLEVVEGREWDDPTLPARGAIN